LNALVQKLNAYVRLSAEDEGIVSRVTGHRAHHHGAQTELVAEGARPEAIQVFLTGWGCRTRMLEDGRRQILSLFLPGDICDIDVLLVARTDHAITTITPSLVSQVSQQGRDEMRNGHLRLRHALAWEGFVSTSIQREWAISLGQRSALERIAHLMCEVFTRLSVVGHTDGNECEFPLTQTEIGEAMGLSTVHVNRTLQELRAASLIVLKDRTLAIPDFTALATVALFDPGYLHLGREGQHLDANKLESPQ